MYVLPMVLPQLMSLLPDGMCRSDGPRSADREIRQIGGGEEKQDRRGEPARERGEVRRSAEAKRGRMPGVRHPELPHTPQRSSQLRCALLVHQRERLARGTGPAKKTR